MANVSMTVPTDYSAEQLSIERRRKLAEAMQAQSTQPIESQTAGGWVIPTSPWQGAAKLAQAFGAAYGQHKADESEKSLAAKYRQDLIDTVTNAERARLGTPGSPQPSADLGGGPAQPASPANAQLANAMLLNHPATQPMGLQGMQRDMQTQAFIQAGQGGQTPTPATPGAPQATQVASIAPTGSVPIGQPQAAPAPAGGAPAGFGGPAGGQPMAAWLATDPSGKAYLEQLAKDRTEADKPVINRGYGLGRMVNGQYVPDKASLDQALSMERGKQEITAPMETPVTIKTSSGQDLQLSRPEYAAFQKSGELPARYAQQGSHGAALPKNVPEQDRAAYEAVASGKVPAAYGPTPSAAKSGLGTVGATQTQTDAIQQAAQTASNTEAGKEFIAEMRQNYGKLRDVPVALENIERAKGLASSQAAQFMGPLGESKLQITKFLRANVPGMANLKTEGVTSVEELRSTLFNQVMDNLKKMDASPSQYQQQVMQEAFGTLGTDPAAVPNILNVFGDILKSRVDIHNKTVESAESRGTNFPYDVRINLPDAKKPNIVKDVVNSGAPQQQASGKRINWSDLK